MQLQEILDLLMDLTEPRRVQVGEADFLVMPNAFGFAFLDETQKFGLDGQPVDGSIIRAASLTEAVEVFQWLLAGKPEKVA